MTDFLYNLMHPLPNAVMTVIMAILAVYWLFAFLSGMGVEALDVDLDFDAEVNVPAVDIDTDAEVDAGADTGDAADHESTTEKSPGYFMKFLNFLNVGKVPFMLIFSTFKLIVWIGSLLTTSFINVTSWGVSSLLILIPIAVIALFFTKFATNPMVKFFKEIGYKGEEEIDFLGLSGKMVSNISGDKVGAAEFVVDNNPIKLNVKSQDGSPINYGDYVVVMDETDDKKFYLVVKEFSIRNL